ncbi:MAG: hypothetical protein ACJAVI_005923 [Candidatus Azotimanducaceae bacterium]
MTVAKSSAASIKIHINTVKPVLEGMRALGFSQDACLEGTDLHLNQLIGTDVGEDYLTLEQEYLLYKNILQISQDPYIGLKIGRTYRVEGMLGYAVLTARTVGEDSRDSLPISISNSNSNGLNQFVEQTTSVSQSCDKARIKYALVLISSENNWVNCPPGLNCPTGFTDSNTY